MTQTKNPFFDQIAGAMTNAAGFADGLRQEGETFFRLQAEKMIGNLDFVKREEFEAARDMAAKAREENEALKARIESLEALVKSRNA